MSSGPRRRKSPYKHPVKHHVRDGHPIRDYERGRGDRRINPRQSRVVGETNPIGPYDVTVFYIGEPREAFSVDAKNYGDALGAGIEMREKPLPPKVIRMRRGR